MKITLNDFGGMAPKIDPRELADNLATLARDVGFESGSLAPANIGAQASPEFQGMPSGTKSIVRPAHDATRLAFSSNTTGEAFASMVAPNDKWGRVYFTTSTGPRFTVRDNYTVGGLRSNPVSYALGMKTPQYQPVVGTPAFTMEGTAQPDLVRVAYVFTFVDAYGHESAPSAPSTIVQLPTNAAFVCRLTFTAESLPNTNVGGALRRVYRAAYDGSSSAWQFIADVPLAASIYDDTVPLGNEGELLVSADWVPPPLLRQMVPMASSFAVGFHDNVLCYSEARLPHAWPEKYRHTLKYQIVGLKPTQNGLLVATSGKPYWAFGSDPASAAPVEIDANYPCVSERSMVDMGGYVVYATQDGLVAVAGQEAKIISGDYIDRLTWLRDFRPAQLVAFAHEGVYVFGHGSTWWAFDPQGGGGIVTLTTLRVTPQSLQQAYYDALRDTTVLLDSAGYAWDVVSVEGGSYRWRSREFSVEPSNFGVGQVLARTYPISMTITADGESRVYSVTSPAPFRLAAGRRARVWQIELEGAGRTSRAVICQSPQELIDG